MFIQQSVQTLVGLNQDMPKKLLATMVVGQRLDAVVIKAGHAADMVAIKVADTLVTIRTPVEVQAGQKLQVEWVLEQGKPVLKLLPSDQLQKMVTPVDSLTKNAALAPLLKVGQQIAVEVIKILAENRLLVQTATVNSPSQAKLAPQQFDIDVSQLSKSYKLGDKLIMDVVNTKPLSIQLRPESLLSREQMISERLRQLLPQSLSPARLDKILSAANKQQLPASVQGAVQQLVQYAVDKSVLTHTNVLKQALATSGVFSESQLLKMPNESNQDFKANISRVLKTLETVMVQTQAELGDKPINKLPTQVQAALLSNGKTPTQLLNVLLSGKSLASGNVAQTILSAITTQEQATALIQLLTKSISAQQQGVAMASRQTPMALAELVALFKELEGVHHKLQHNQLSMLKEPESSSVVASWLFDLPIKDKHNVDLLQMQIDQQKKQAEKDEESWQVQLRLDTQNLGPVQASVTLHGDDVKVVIRAEKAESAALLAEHLPLLNATLARLNVSISHISCLCGAVSKSAIRRGHAQAEPNGLVDISV